MLPPAVNAEDYADIILAYGSNDTTRGFVNVGFENESISEFPLDSASQGSGSGWVGTLGSTRGLNPIDEGPEIVYMDAKTAALQGGAGSGGGSTGKKVKKGTGKVRWVKSKSLDDIRNTIRHTQRQVAGRRARGSGAGSDDGEKEPFSVSSGWLGDDPDNNSMGRMSPRSGSGRIGASPLYHTVSNLNSDSCVSEATLYSTSANSGTFNFSHQNVIKPDCSPYETVHFQHQDEVAL